MVNFLHVIYNINYDTGYNMKYKIYINGGILMEKEKTAKKIIDAAGGKENISNVTACMTRLRFTLKDEDKVDSETMKNIDGVLGSQYQNEQLQVIIGTEVNKLLPVVSAELDKENEGETTESIPREISSEESKENSSGNKQKYSGKDIIKNILSYISTSFSPVLIAIIGAGVVKGLNILFSSTFGLYAPDSGIAEIINIIGDAPFYFLPMLLAYGAARKLDTNIPLALVLAGSFMYPSIINNVGESWSLAVMNVPLIGYNGTVVPILLSVWVMSYLYDFLDNKVHQNVRLVVIPVLLMFIMVPLQLIVLGPIGFYLSSGVAAGLEWLFSLNRWVAGFIYGSVRQFLVLTGLHMSLTPIMLENIRVSGSDYLAPVHAMSSMAVAGTTLGVFFKAKKENIKTAALSSFFPAFIGVTEPGIYSIIVKYMKPFIAVAIGGGLGSAYVAGMGAEGVAFALPSPLSIAVYAESIPTMIIGWVISLVSSFVIAYILGVDETL